MTPQEIQRTMDFILRSQADSIIRMEQWGDNFEKELEKIRETSENINETVAATATENRESAKLIRQNAAAIRAREKENRAYEKRSGLSRHPTGAPGNAWRGIKDLLRLFSKRQDLYSRPLDRLERR